MRISVAMAARNGERYLPQLLESLAGQSAPPYELVVYDDASSDTTPEILHAFASSAPFPVRVLGDSVRHGHVEAFFRSARATTGDAIAFCDHDDVWLERKLEVCGEQLEGSDAWLLMHAVRVVDSELRDLGRNWPAIEATREVPPLGQTDLATDAPGMAMVLRRRLLDVVDRRLRPRSRFDPSRLMLHDEWVFFLAGVVAPVRLVSEPLVLWRQHEANDSGGWFERRRRLTLRPAVEDYRNAAEHTGACARVLGEARTGDADLDARLAAGAREYRRAAESWRLRMLLYGARDRRTRARLLRQLLAARAYRSRTVGGFGRVAFGKDALAGVALREGASR